MFYTYERNSEILIFRVTHATPKNSYSELLKPCIPTRDLGVGILASGLGVHRIPGGAFDVSGSSDVPCKKGRDLGLGFRVESKKIEWG